MRRLIAGLVGAASLVVAGAAEAQSRTVIVREEVEPYPVLEAGVQEGDTVYIEKAALIWSDQE